MVERPGGNSSMRVHHLRVHIYEHCTSAHGSWWGMYIEEVSCLLMREGKEHLIPAQDKFGKIHIIVNNMQSNKTYHFELGTAFRMLPPGSARRPSPWFKQPGSSNLSTASLDLTHIA
eukprot:1157562-Pelagomonas_calceolata.AAC.2